MEPENAQNPLPSCDRLTVVSIGFLAGALADFIHEGLGHGGACLLVGGKPTLITSMNFVWEAHGFPGWALRAVSAGGTIANLLAGALALALLRRLRFAAPLHYFLWLFAAVNLYVGTGYFLFSGVSNIGDWANFIVGLPSTWLWRGLLVLLGGSSYYFCVRVMLAKAVPLTGGDPAVRYRRANVLMRIPYFAGAVLSLSAGLLNPHAKALILISAVAASLGGTVPTILFRVSSTPVLRRHWLPSPCFPLTLLRNCSRRE